MKTDGKTRRELLKTIAVVAGPIVLTLAPSSARARGSWSDRNRPIEDALLPGTWSWRNEQWKLKRAEVEAEQAWDLYGFKRRP